MNRYWELDKGGLLKKAEHRSTVMKEVVSEGIEAKIVLGFGKNNTHFTILFMAQNSWTNW